MAGEGKFGRQRRIWGWSRCRLARGAETVRSRAFDVICLSHSQKSPDVSGTWWSLGGHLTVGNSGKSRVSAKNDRQAFRSLLEYSRPSRAQERNERAGEPALIRSEKLLMMNL